jgi:hypothetical protein
MIISVNRTTRMVSCYTFLFLKVKLLRSLQPPSLIFSFCCACRSSALANHTSSTRSNQAQQTDTTKNIHHIKETLRKRAHLTIRHDAKIAKTQEQRRMELPSKRTRDYGVVCNKIENTYCKHDFNLLNKVRR